MSNACPTPSPHHVEILWYITEQIITSLLIKEALIGCQADFTLFSKRNYCVLSLIKAHSVTGTYHMLLYSFFIKYSVRQVLLLTTTLHRKKLRLRQVKNLTPSSTEGKHLTEKNSFLGQTPRSAATAALPKTLFLWPKYFKAISSYN